MVTLKLDERGYVRAEWEGLMLKDLIDECIALKQGNRDFVLFYWPDEPDNSPDEPWMAVIGNSGAVVVGEVRADIAAAGSTAEECLRNLIVKLKRE